MLQIIFEISKYRILQSSLFSNRVFIIIKKNTIRSYRLIGASKIGETNIKGNEGSSRNSPNWKVNEIT